MHRNYLKSLLTDYKPEDPCEIVCKTQMLSFIEICENCFERSCAVGHFTASAWLLNKDATEVLLMQHAKLNRWLQLGGHCDGDANVLRVAIKEAQEESGIIGIEPVMERIFDIDMHLIPNIKQELAHYHFDIRFFLRVTSDEKIKSNNESKALQWFVPRPELLPTAEPSIIRMLNKSSAFMHKHTIEFS